MTFLDLVNDLLCAACCLRLILFARHGSSHHPWASVLAYLLIIAFGAMVILPWLDRSVGYGLAQLLLNGVLIGALFAAKGDVTTLFKPRAHHRPSSLLRILKRRTWL
jgi:hypothetical protein